MTCCLLCAAVTAPSHVAIKSCTLCQTLSHIYILPCLLPVYYATVRTEHSEVLKVSVVTHSRRCQHLCCNFVYTLFQHIMPTTHQPSTRFVFSLLIVLPLRFFCCEASVKLRNDRKGSKLLYSLVS